MSKLEKLVKEDKFLEENLKWIILKEKSYANNKKRRKSKGNNW
jgi:hypothetical protein